MKLSLFLALWLCTASPLFADLISIASVTMNRTSHTNNCQPGGVTVGSTEAVYSLPACTDVGPDVPPDRPFTYQSDAIARSGYGSLTTSLSGGSEMDGFAMYSSANFSDAFSFSGNGMAYLSFDFAVWQFPAYPVQTELVFNNAGVALVPDIQDPREFTLTFSTPTFNLATPVGVDLLLISQAWTGFVGYSETDVRVTAVNLFTESGVPINGYTYDTSSEAAYPMVGGSLVPEPSTVLMLASGLLAVSWRWRRSLWLSHK